VNYKDLVFSVAYGKFGSLRLDSDRKNLVCVAYKAKEKDLFTK